MRRINPSGRRKSSKPTAASSPHTLAPAVVGTLVALATALAFLPVLQNAFVAWDDYETLVDHSRYRGFGWAQLSWMFTTFYMGHYQPLTWLSFAADSAIWGIDPFGFHLTNLLLHSLNALAGFFVARQVLRLVFPDSAARPWWYGALYGVAAYVVMSRIVVPLSAANSASPSLGVLVNGLLIHIVGVGIPTALAARAAARPVRSVAGA